jgi:hypothetical protein
MTEREWLTSTSAQRMLQYVVPRMDDRKPRLFAVACYRRLVPVLSDRHRCARARTSLTFVRRALRVMAIAERYAEGEVGDAERVAARATIEDGTGAVAWTAFAALAHPCRAADAGNSAVLAAVWAIGEKTSAARYLRKELRAWQRGAVRDLFGNPFRTPRIDPTWLTWNNRAVAKLATQIYDKSAFDRLPVLADALEEAGCSDRILLNHLRSAGPHYRGCWALDALLGKSP